MQKNNRYFTKITAAEAGRNFTIPTNTAGEWQKSQFKADNWRGHLIDRLKLFTLLQQDSTDKIKTIFTKKELQAIWGSLKSTIIDYRAVQDKNILNYEFEAYCTYEALEAAQFGDVETLRTTVVKKLSTLSCWDRYCLLEFLANCSREIF